VYVWQSEESSIPHTIDYFRGKFTPDTVHLQGNQTQRIEFSINPSVDVENATIKIILPADLVKIVEGDLRWNGDIKKDESIQLAFTIKQNGEVKEYVRAYIEGYINGTKIKNSYYLPVSTNGR
jgi:hypothetical protein